MHAHTHTHACACAPRLKDVEGHALARHQGAHHKEWEAQGFVRAQGLFRSLLSCALRILLGAGEQKEVGVSARVGSCAAHCAHSWQEGRVVVNALSLAAGYAHDNTSM